MKHSMTSEELNNAIKQGVYKFNKKGKLIQQELLPEYEEMIKKSKYNAKKTIYNEVKYDSKKEANFAMKLDMAIEQGDILGYVRQVRIPIVVNDHKICTYICDFVTSEHDGNARYIDVKGMKSGQAYQMFRLKKKLVFALYNIDIIEV